MQVSVSDALVTGFRLNLAEMVKSEFHRNMEKGIKEGVAIRSIAKGLDKTPEFILNQLAITELPSSIIGLLRTNPIAFHVALSIWKRSKGNPDRALMLLTKAIQQANIDGAKKVMLKHAV